MFCFHFGESRAASSASLPTAASWTGGTWRVPSNSYSQRQGMRDIESHCFITCYHYWFSCSGDHVRLQEGCAQRAGHKPPGKSIF